MLTEMCCNVFGHCKQSSVGHLIIVFLQFMQFLKHINEGVYSGQMFYIGVF